MKVVGLILFFLIAIVNLSVAKPKPGKKNCKIISTKNHVVYFKVNKSFVGGWVEIYDDHENFIEADSLSHTHTMIYFDEMPPGNYTVKVRKGEESLEFKYGSI